jgi:hypothetical protein
MIDPNVVARRLRAKEKLEEIDLLMLVEFQKVEGDGSEQIRLGKEHIFWSAKLREAYEEGIIVIIPMP